MAGKTPTKRPSKALARSARGTSASGDGLLVKADADKLFFIQMLVKDIELVPAVLDLVDNSVDGARAMLLEENPDVIDADGGIDGDYSKRVITVTADPTAFEIRDNCGGIDLDVARNYAFRFGRAEDYEGTPGSVGEFGVGMKRALFKLGRAFQVTSRTPTTSFFLDVDVEDWAEEEGPWTFRLHDAQTDLPPPADGWTGTHIKVTRLHDTVQEDFDGPLLGQLREQMRLRHQGAIQDGMTISLNGTRLTPFLPQLLSGPDFQPINRTFQLQQPTGTVFVKLTAGIVGSPRDREHVDESRGENFQDVGDAGWWVFCNDRLLLMRDRTGETGWGRGPAAYHPQYRRFRGYVFLTAANTALLPWNTTKTGVDQDSRVWRQVFAEMRTALVEVQSVINRLKNESESADTDDRQAAPMTWAVSTAVSTPLAQLPPRVSVHVPRPPAPRPRPPKPTVKTVTYSVALDRFAEVADELGTANASEIGRRTFDYFYEREV
jgi:hypothetical protein